MELNNRIEKELRNCKLIGSNVTVESLAIPENVIRTGILCGFRIDDRKDLYALVSYDNIFCNDIHLSKILELKYICSLCE